jgi:hypothetical protein
MIIPGHLRPVIFSLLSTKRLSWGKPNGQASARILVVFIRRYVRFMRSGCCMRIAATALNCNTWRWKSSLSMMCLLALQVLRPSKHWYLRKKEVLGKPNRLFSFKYDTDLVENEVPNNSSLQREQFCQVVTQQRYGDTQADPQTLF